MVATAAAPASGQEDTANVRIVVTHEFERSEREDSASIGLRRRRIEPRLGSSRATTRGRTQQQLLVMSGGQASILVAEEVPYSEWFWAWGAQRGLWGAGPGLVQGTGWREVGASLLVEPQVLGGGRIRVRLTPRFSYFLDRARLSTDVHELSTEVMVRDGEEIDVGGLPLSDSEFRERFLVGFGSSGASQRLSVRLRATAEPLAPR